MSLGGAPGSFSPRGCSSGGCGGRRLCLRPAGGKQDQGGAGKRLRWGPPPRGCPGGTCDLSPLPKKKKKEIRKRGREREANKLGFFPINPEIQRDLKSFVGRRRLEKGKGVPARRGDGRGSLLSVSSPRPGSSALAARVVSGSWGHTVRGDGPPASGTEAAGMGAELRAARGQVANWIRERGGESRGRGGEPGGGAGAARAAERGSCPHPQPPSLPHRRERRGSQGECAASPGEDARSPKPLPGPRCDPGKTPAWGAAPGSGAGRSRGPGLCTGPEPWSWAGALGRGWAGSGRGRRRRWASSAPWAGPRTGLGVEVGWGKAS